MEFQTLYQEFLGSTAILHSLLNGLSPQDTRLKPDPEFWSILEVLCHLYDEDREDFRTHLDLILNRPSESWPTIDPQTWVKVRNYNEQNFGEMKDKFFAQRAECLGWLKGLRGRDWGTKYVSQYGEMLAGEMFCSWIAHDNLHMRQLVELRRMLIEKVTSPYSIEYAGDW